MLAAWLTGCDGLGTVLRTMIGWLFLDWQWGGQWVYARSRRAGLVDVGQPSTGLLAVERKEEPSQVAVAVVVDVCILPVGIVHFCPFHVQDCFVDQKRCRLVYLLHRVDGGCASPGTRAASRRIIPVRPFLLASYATFKRPALHHHTTSSCIEPRIAFKTRHGKHGAM